MTYAQFLQRLEQTPRDWCIGALGRIRRRSEEHWQCPISACTDTDAGHFLDAAVELGLPVGEANRIMFAADDCGDLQVRADLERACGLREEKA